MTSGPSADNVTINFLTALCDFTEEKGATRVIPASNHWDDFNEMGSHEDTIPALLNAGDVLLIDGKVVHGGGANTTTDQYRRAMAWSFTIGWLASEEAHAFVVPMDLVKTLPAEGPGSPGLPFLPQRLEERRHVVAGQLRRPREAPGSLTTRKKRTRLGPEQPIVVRSPL